MHCEPVDGDTDTHALAARIEHAIRERIGVGVTVHVLAPGEVPRSEGKAVRVIDER